MPQNQNIQIENQRKEIVANIEDFLEDWKEKVFNYYMDKRKTIKPMLNTESYFTTIDNFYIRRYSVFSALLKSEEKQKIYAEKYNVDLELLQKEIKKYNEDRKYIEFVMDNVLKEILNKSKNEATTYLTKLLEKESILRKEKFISTIEHTGGKMLRLVSLEIGLDSMLNGIVSCVDADVSLQTIGAGGYNIQKYHYRVLCHKLKQRRNKHIKQDLENYIPEKELTKEEIDEEYFKKVILSQAERLEKKLNQNGKSRGKDIWDKINDLGYLPLIQESGYQEYLKTLKYPIYKKPLTEDMDFVWCMAFAYKINKDLTKPAKNRIQLWWNVEGTDSMSRVLDITERFKNLTELKLLVPLMAKRGNFPRYGEKSEAEKKKEKVAEQLNNLPKRNITTEQEVNEMNISEIEKNHRIGFIRSVPNTESYADYRGVKVWKRMQEYNYDKKLMDIGYKILIETQYYPVFYKDIDSENRIILAPSFGYTIMYADTRNFRYIPDYYIIKNGTDKISTVEKLYEETGLEEYKLMSEVMNLRKKLTPYKSATKEFKKSASNKTISKYKIPVTTIEPVIQRLLENNKHKETTERTQKILNKIKDLNYYQFFKDLNADIVQVDNKIPPIVFVEQTMNRKKVTFIMTIQQLYYIDSDNKLKLIADLTKQDITLEELNQYGKKLTSLIIIVFSNLNNLRNKLDKYGK